MREWLGSRRIPSDSNGRELLKALMKQRLGSRRMPSDSNGRELLKALSILDHYMGRPTTPHFQGMTLLQFIQQYTMPKGLGANPQSKNVVVIARPFCSSDPNGPKYEQYCRQKLMQHVPFRHQDELMGEHNTYAAAYETFLQSASVPSSLEEDIYQLEQSRAAAREDTEVSPYWN